MILRDFILHYSVLSNRISSDLNFYYFILSDKEQIKDTCSLYLGNTCPGFELC